MSDKPMPRYQAHENNPYDWEITDFHAVPPRTFAIELTKTAAEAVVAELNKLCADMVGCEVVSEVMLADCRRQSDKIVAEFKARLAQCESEISNLEHDRDNR